MCLLLWLSYCGLMQWPLSVSWVLCQDWGRALWFLYWLSMTFVNPLYKPFIKPQITSVCIIFSGVLIYIVWVVLHCLWILIRKMSLSLDSLIGFLGVWIKHLTFIFQIECKTLDSGELNGGLNEIIYVYVRHLEYSSHFHLKKLYWLKWPIFS